LSKPGKVPRREFFFIVFFLFGMRFRRGRYVWVVWLIMTLDFSAG
jgi:hypothetical protein